MKESLGWVVETNIEYPVSNESTGMDRYSTRPVPSENRSE